MPRPRKIPKNIPVIQNEAVQKLIEAFKLDATVGEACIYANIARSTYYNYLASNPEFMDKIEASKQYLRLLSRQVVANAIIGKKDVKVAQWYLERKVKDEFGKLRHSKLANKEESEVIKSVEFVVE